MKGYALKKWDSTLNLCVHAHGYYVELIMKASGKSNYPLGINSAAPMILHSTFEYYPWYLEDIIPWHYILWIVMKLCLSMSSPFHGSGLSSTENTAYLLLHRPFCLVMLLFNCILLKSLDVKCRGHHQ